MKKYSFSVMLLAMMLVIAACGEADETGGDAEGDDDQTEETGDDNGDGDEETAADWASDVTVLTGGEQGVYFPLGGAMAQIISDNVDDVAASGVSTGASVVNVNDIQDGMGELALVQNDIAYFAQEGMIMFDENLDGFSGIATLYPEVVQIVALEDSGIETVDDLEGKRVAVGDQGSGTEANASQILESHGITYDDINPEYMAFGDAAGGLQDGNLDAAFITAGTPTGAIESLQANRDIVIVSINQDAIDDLTSEYPYYTEFTVDGDTYGTEDATTVAVQAMLIASNDLPEDQVYEMTRAIFENLDVIEGTHARGADITIESAQDGMSIDLHPGAERYFDEQ
ncbi:TAXI family TRAP transporter solute-binding subunit [Alteribacter natronophilus]|uniref:TAXI family TRAP transporter solute-binding subunit n=1 Tax=Alteribacter natronophilus TaxID=2583810 RepID=UPI00110EAF9E|nr:TAXI family TRAP transporter solute-binding subunit [Alteribacter natronophilus]TMW72333.1 TAXI family TRAP transporter solute-binding subunit [Alteribacter natronophilus]